MDKIVFCRVECSEFPFVIADFLLLLIESLLFGKRRL
jgi:hypothetical protein